MRLGGVDLTSWRPTALLRQAPDLRRWSVRAAPWVGLFHLWLVLGLSVSMQFILADPSSHSSAGGWLQTAPRGWLVGPAVSGVVTVVVALMSGLVVRAARTFGALVTLWVGSAALSALALVGTLTGEQCRRRLRALA